MAKEITYIIGAGASCYSMPLVENFPDRFDLFLKFLDTVPGFDVMNSLKSEFSDFAKEIKHHVSFDTFFKKQFHLSGTTTNRYKVMLMLFFLFEYLVDVKDYEVIRQRDFEKTDMGKKKSNQDPRYEALTAGLLRPVINDFLFNVKVNFITWNYDLNLLSALKSFMRGEPSIAEFLKKYISNNNIIDLKGEVKIINMNGIIQHPGLDVLGPVELEEIKDYFKEIVHKFYKQSAELDDLVKNIKFSWETIAENNENIQTVPHIKEARDAIQRSGVLIIIGYSFPLYNRLIDSELINRDSVKGKMIYVQDPHAASIESILRNDLGLGNATGPQDYAIGVDPQTIYHISQIDDCRSFFVPSSLFFNKEIKPETPSGPSVW